MARPKSAPKKPRRKAPPDPRPLYLQLMDLLRASIREQNLLPGARLPSERELMRTHRMSYPTVTRALRELAHEGVLERRQGKGTFLKERPVSAASAAAARDEVTLGGPFPPMDHLQVSAILERFAREHPEIRVRVENGDRAGEADIFRTIGNHSWAVAQRAAPLDAYTAALPEKDRPHPQALELFRHDGRQVGMPRSFAACVLYFRRDLFRAAGLAEPSAEWTWDDLRAAAVALNDPQHGRMGLGIVPAISHLMPYLWQSGGGLWDHAARQCLLDTPPTQRALAFYRELYVLGPADLRIRGEGGHSAFERFARGEVAMLIWGGHLAARLRSEPATCPEGEAWSVAPLPSGPAECRGAFPAPGATVFFSEGLCVHKRAEHDPRVWTLLRALTGLDAARDLSAQGYRLAALPAAWERDAITAQFERTLSAGRLIYEARQPALYAKANWALSALFTTDAPTEAVVKEAGAILQELLDHGGEAGLQATE
ncbi:MAG: extracellular solute-binding protein [Planctomycetes bacterium]|nr:extracellular solute-binding protein [Planctomycetota bacterium]